MSSTLLGNPGRLLVGLLALGMAGGVQGQLATNLGADIRAMSMGHAVTADPPGIMSVHFNPAGLAKLEGRRMDLQFLAADFNLETEFSAPPDYGVFGFSDDPVVCADPPDSGSDACIDFKTGRSTVEGPSVFLPMAGGVDLPSGPVVGGPLPSFSIKPPGSRFTFATAVYAPQMAGFHRSDDDPGNFMGRRVALNRFTYLSPSIGYQLTDSLSIGASIGFSYQGVMLETDMRAPNELLGFARIMDEDICGQLSGEANFAIDIILFGMCRPEEGLGPFKSLASMEVEMEQRLSPSYNLGVLWEPRDWFSWGAVWHAPVDMRMKGDYRIGYSNATQETINGIGASPTGGIALAVLGIPSQVGEEETGKIGMDLTMPAHFQTGISVKPFDRWKFNVDAVWVDYSEWDAFNMEFDRSNAALAMARLFSPGSTSQSLNFPLDYESSFNLAFGAEYSLTDRLRLRAGYEPRASAIPDDQRGPMVPINEARYYSIGAGYQWDRHTEVDIAFATLRSRDRIPADTSSGGNKKGLANLIYNPYAGLDMETRADVNMMGLAFRTRF